LTLRFAADENFNGKIVRGLFRVIPGLDLVRIQDTSLAGSGDDEVLEWAAREHRVVLTHDVGTMARAAWDRVRAGLPMKGVIEIDGDQPIGTVITDLQLMALACSPDELDAQVLFLPL
jgi:hypothetical protein